MPKPQLNYFVELPNHTAIKEVAGLSIAQFQAFVLVVNDFIDKELQGHAHAKKAWTDPYWRVMAVRFLTQFGWQIWHKNRKGLVKTTPKAELGVDGMDVDAPEEENGENEPQDEQDEASPRPNDKHKKKKEQPMPYEDVYVFPDDCDECAYLSFCMIKLEMGKGFKRNKIPKRITRTRRVRKAAGSDADEDAEPARVRASRRKAAKRSATNKMKGRPASLSLEPSAESPNLSGGSADEGPHDDNNPYFLDEGDEGGSQESQPIAVSRPEIVSEILASTPASKPANEATTISSGSTSSAPSKKSSLKGSNGTSSTSRAGLNKLQFSLPSITDSSAPSTDPIQRKLPARPVEPGRWAHSASAESNSNPVDGNATYTAPSDTVTFAELDAMTVSESDADLDDGGSVAASEHDESDGGVTLLTSGTSAAGSAEDTTMNDADVAATPAGTEKQGATDRGSSTAATEPHIHNRQSFSSGSRSKPHRIHSKSLTKVTKTPKPFPPWELGNVHFTFCVTFGGTPGYGAGNESESAVDSPDENIKRKKAPSHNGHPNKKSKNVASMTIVEYAGGDPFSELYQELQRGFSKEENKNLAKAKAVVIEFFKGDGSVKAAQFSLALLPENVTKAFWEVLVKAVKGVIAMNEAGIEKDKVVWMGETPEDGIEITLNMRFEDIFFSP